MKKIIAIPVIAWILSATTPSQIANDPKTIIEPTFDVTKSKVVSVLSQKQNIPDNLQKAIDEAKNHNLDNKLSKNPNQLLFPSSVQTIGIKRMAEWFLWNMSKWWFVEGVNPLMVDVEWQDQVNCAATMKSFIAFSKNPSDRTNGEDNYVRKQYIDAWTLPEELKKIWYEQKINLMNHFDKNKVWNNDIVNDKEWYKKTLIETWKYLEKEWKIWSLLFIYFNLSNYKWVVRDYNAQQKLSNPNYTPHINTHEAIFLWNSYMEFKADEVKVIHWGHTSEMKESVDIVDYIANFVQQRWWYNPTLDDYTKKVIKENLKTFYSLIGISINWELINLEEELKKSPEERIKISKGDIIKISGPVLLDWFHNKNSKNRYISDNNHARTIFYWEYVLIWTYTPSELMEPNDDFYERKGNKNIVLQNLTDNLKISNLYYLKSFEDIDLKLKEAILRFKFWKTELLSDTNEEIELSNQISDLNNSSKWKMLMQKEVFSKKEKTKKIISNLSNEEKVEFEKEYTLQIHWLQMIWYMQYEWLINDWAVYVNRPIPYFDTNNIETNFQKYIEQRKSEIALNKDENIDTNKIINIYFYPTDNFAKVYSQLQDTLRRYVSRYPIFSRLDDLDQLKKNKLVDIIIDKVSDDKSIDISNWKVPSMRSVSIPLDFIDNELKNILDELYIDKLPPSYIDNAVIKKIAKTEQDRAILAYIITQETYEQWLPIRKWVKKIWSIFGKTSSTWDFQLKLFNLINKDIALSLWPNIEQIQKSLSYLDDEDIKLLIDRRQRRFDWVESDLILVEELKKLLVSVNDTNRVEVWNKVYDIFKELFKFNDSRAINIVWKIIQASLTLDKVHELGVNLNAWFNNAWIPLEEIHYNKELQKRYYKALLVMYNRWEWTTLVWLGENYVLRCLDALWYDINDNSFPKLKKSDIWEINLSKINDFHSFYKTWLDILAKVISWHVDYDREKEEHYNFYNWILSFSDWDDNNETIALKKELLKEIHHIQKSNYSSNSIYKLFKNKIISDYLKDHNYDNYPIPTLAELENTPFRRLFFDNAKTPEWRTPPKTYNFKMMWGVASWIWFILLWSLWKLLWNRRRKRKNPQKSSVQASKPSSQLVTDNLEKA